MIQDGCNDLLSPVAAESQMWLLKTPKGRKSLEFLDSPTQYRRHALDRIGLRTRYSCKLRGYRRQTCFRNRVQMRTFESILARFRRIVLDALVLNGILLAQGYGG